MVNGALATVAAGWACMPGSRPLSTPAASTTMSPSTVSAAMVRKSAHLAGGASRRSSAGVRRKRLMAASPSNPAKSAALRRSTEP